ncbi:4-alpha-glucanotransferase [Sulfitobacter aestuariivivens]|uniref:4-alpha-glucanotransferase n=1 Tax=Sulfitobacter aestuariivivens TaxID=2766981 RepID=UPI00361158C4
MLRIGSQEITILAAPDTLPQVPRQWGMTCALYGLASDRNAGLGDYEDLARTAEALGAHGAGFLGINPVHNMGYADHDTISPYSPSHRGYLNTAHIALDKVPGAARVLDEPTRAKLRNARTIPYRAHKSAHHAALETLHRTFRQGPKDAEFQRFKSGGGDDLLTFARFEALSELGGPDWRDWSGIAPEPANLQVDYHVWLQWHAAQQLAAAQSRALTGGMGLGLYLDLAVGPRRGGAETWCAQGSVAQGVSIGAPPDHLSPGGQNWMLAAYAPRKLRDQRYRPWRRVLAQTMAHAGIIRIDHVLGLYRSFWIPDDGSPGGYIRQPLDALTAVIKIEAARHGCAVIGEDLGLVPKGFRDTMRGHGFYGYAVMQYEKDAKGRFPDPARSPTQVLSCFATHDTPTVDGYATGRDIDWWEKLGWIDAARARAEHCKRAGEVSAVSKARPFATEVHDRLAVTNATLAAVQLDDVLQETETQNLPGTVDEHPNWQRRYDVKVDALRADNSLAEIAQMMQDAGRGPQEGPKNED